MLIQWFGDQAIMVNHVAKFSWMTAQMVAAEYDYLHRVRPKVQQMRHNYPDIRLDIGGNFNIH